ncbi:MAG TPA: GNAT family N-acetyltransferase [Tepidisphaeraceae bacterium]|nr:GNAT family N-acetyltransferase [Tepidisphaeraceae bacterium]
MSHDALAQWGLSPVTPADRATLEPYFASLAAPLSDYTFSQLFTWRNSLRIAWAVLDNHLCVFANGSGDLTLLIPPIGDTNSDRALARATEIMNDYNAAHNVPDRTRVEYVSEELLARFDASKLTVTPQGTDYLYDVSRMIDLAGGDLSSKRQAKNRFMRNYTFRSEAYDKAKHFDGCRELLNAWKERQDDAHAGETSNAIKRTKESLATQLTLEHADALGLKGMAVYVNDAEGVERLKGFTFGEALGSDQSSIVVEKTDLECKGLAQYIFSEFCRTAWADRPLVNAGDDWGLESLAWTKNSYRPVKLLKKFVMAPPAKVQSAVGGGQLAVVEIGQPARQEEVVVIGRTEGVLIEIGESKPGCASGGQCPPYGSAERAPETRCAAPEITIRAATRADLEGVNALEQSCFSTYKLSRRQLSYLQARQTAVFLVAEADGQIVGEGIALVRHHKSGTSGRIYSLAVDPARRGLGLGERLMKQMLAQLAGQGVRRVYLEVEGSNLGALKLYERLGFATIGKLPDYYGEGHDGVHMMFTQAVPVSPVAA